MLRATGSTEERRKVVVHLPFEPEPSRVVAFIAAVLIIAWSMFLAVSALDLFGSRARIDAWRLIFNHRPVEWLQWVFHAATAVTGAYVAGQLRRTERRGVADFWILMAAASAMFLIEDAGDIRHTFRDGLGDALGERPAGVPHQLLADVPYFGLMAAVPIYALARYGRHPWGLGGVPRFLGTAVGVYAFVGAGNALRFLGDYYERLGARFHDLLAGGNLPVPEGWTREEMEFHLIDGPVEESLELVASGTLFAALLATIRAINQQARPGGGPRSSGTEASTPG